MTSFLNALPGAVSQGLIWGIMAIGLYISYKILDIADLTVDGSICTGACVCAVLLGLGVPVWICVPVAFVAGALAGVVTGLLHTALGIPSILAGILTQIGLWSVNYMIIGSANQVIRSNKYDVLVASKYVKDVPFFKNSITGSMILIVSSILLKYQSSYSPNTLKLS